MDKLTKIFLVCMVLTLFNYAEIIAPVKIIKVQMSEISEFVEGHGVIAPLPSKDIKISSVSPMKIESFLVKPGDRVKKGELVIKLQRDHTVDMAVKKVKVKLEQLKINFERAERLFQAGVISRVTLENSTTEYELGKSEYNLQLQSQKYAVENSEIRSPIDGIVSSVNGAIGQVADPANNLIRIVNLNNVIANIGVETEDMARIKVGQRARVSIPNVMDGKVFDGKVLIHNEEIDTSTRLLHIWIKIKNTKKKLRPGMFAEAQIFVKTHRNIIALPRKAVLKDKSGFYIFKIKNQRAIKVYVNTGINNDEKIEIVNGVNIGDKVVCLGNYELESGMKVKILQ